MSELENIKHFFNIQFEKYIQSDIGFRYEHDASTGTHMIEVSNEGLFQQEDFKEDSFEFSMNFIEEFNEFILFLKPSDPVHISRVDYSENNICKKVNYVTSQKIEGTPMSHDNLKEKYTNAKQSYSIAA